MIVYVLDAKYGTQHLFDVEPACGQDFCDGCGDCLACYDCDPCSEGSHRRIVYADQSLAWLAAHLDAENVDHLILPSERTRG